VTGVLRSLLDASNIVGKRKASEKAAAKAASTVWRLRRILLQS